MVFTGIHGYDILIIKLVIFLTIFVITATFPSKWIHDHSMMGERVGEKLT